MTIDITVIIGGEAGQGIQTVGELLAQAGHRAGLYIQAINDFESRIRGGHSFMQLRISDAPVNCPDHRVHLLVALTPETYDLHKDELAEDGVILVDQEEQCRTENAYCVPITRLAKDAGGKIMANTVAAGACLGLLGGAADILKNVLAERFAGKSASVLEQNNAAAEKGAAAVEHIDFRWRFQWPDKSAQGLLISGSRAIALGALAADCRFAAFYPMSPATSIFVHLHQLAEEYPVVVEQAEGEIAAANMVIGAAFAGVRAMTATSGGGFSLMSEALGMAGITETPMVIVNAQRPGPATGLPTRTGQGDLLFVINAAQDEFPRFVLAPASVTGAFETMIRAFDLTEKYQVPVIVLVDQYFNDSLFVAEKELAVPETITRYTVTDADMADPSAYRRFALTKSGVSPRALPCNGDALVMVTANEHGEDGHLSERQPDRNNQMAKRKAKLPQMTAEMAAPGTYYGDSPVLLVGWGSTDAVICEAVERLRAEGHNVGCVHFTDLWPFPAEAAEKALSGAGRFYMVELNHSAQLGWLIRQQTGLKFTDAIVKIDGRPLRAADIVYQFKRLEE